jgi:hypothetical protein
MPSSSVASSMVARLYQLPKDLQAVSASAQAPVAEVISKHLVPIKVPDP